MNEALELCKLCDERTQGRNDHGDQDPVRAAKLRIRRHLNLERPGPNNPGPFCFGGEGKKNVPLARSERHA